jgi:ribosomal-protein-alanine N-acetyltransferase
MPGLCLPDQFPFADPELPYLIEPMSVGDLRQVMAIERTAFSSPWPASAYQHELTQNDLSTYLVLRQQEARPKPGLRRLVGRRLGRAADGPLLGYGGFWMIVDEAHISTLAVHPEWRGRGLGELLLVALIEAAVQRGARVATLEVRVSNVVAQALYGKHAFAQVGRRKAYYTDNREDALIMTTPRLDEPHFAARYAARKERLQMRLRAQSRARLD